MTLNVFDPFDDHQTDLIIWTAFHLKVLYNFLFWIVWSSYKICDVTSMVCNRVDHTKVNLILSLNNIENYMPVKYVCFNSHIEFEQSLTFMWILLVLGCHKWSFVPYKAPTDPQGADCTFWCRFCCQRNVTRFQ